MVLKGYIKIISVTIVFSMLALVFSCEKTGQIIICSECLSSEPVDANLEISLERNQQVTVNIYEGNLEDSIIYESINTESSTLYRTLPLNRKYTFTATYYDRGDYYIVVNSVTPRVKYDEAFCEEPCYYVFDKHVDLRLKYTKYGKY
jgi:hypothetical protein